MRQTGTGYIISESADFWLTGGISIVVMCFVLLCVAVFGVESYGLQVSTILGSAMVLQVLLNWPHFMGSYSILYSPRKNIRKYKAATIYVPVTLLLVIIASLDFSSQGPWYAFTVNTRIAYFLWLAAAFYLAWHYTGQAWGMMATFAATSGLSFTSAERMIFRYGLRVLLVWHVVWGAQDLPANWFGGYLSRNIGLLLDIANVLAILSFLITLRTLLAIRNRTGTAVDRRIVASWLSIYLWYLVLFFLPEAFMLVQASHALQYLAFPFRVELNRAEGKGSAKKGKKNKAIKTLPILTWGGRYYFLLVLSGIAVFYIPELLFPVDQNSISIAFMIASAVSVHHYFVDSCIWHIRNEEVKCSLFSHLPRLKK